MKRSFAVIVAIALGLAGCSTSRGRDPTPATGSRGTSSGSRRLPTGTLRIASASGAVLTLDVEVADTPEASAAGLMGVERLSDRRGMVFPQQGPSSIPFWMKDTLIPLDIAFWAEGGRIIDIQQMQPCTVADSACPRYRSRGPYVGALEVNLGLLGRSGVTIGDVVTLVRR